MRTPAESAGTRGRAPAASDHAAQLRAQTRRRRRETALLLTPALLWVLVAVVIPLGMIVWVSFWRADGPTLVHTFDLTTWDNVISSGAFRSLAWQTVKVVLIVLAIVATVGLLSGYFLARFVRSRRLAAMLLMLAILPFWTSYVIRIITWQPLFGNRGVLNYILTKVGILDQPADVFLYNQTAMIFAMASLYVVFVIGPVFWALSRIDDDVIAASRSLGASAWQTFWRVEFPLAKGGLVAGCFFAAIFLFGDYATEQLIGGGTNPALSGTIRAIAGSGQWPTAAALSVVLLALAAIVLGVFMKIHDLRREL
ncbi:ABC transporter permease [Conexibacter sp. CPCC 206217]|uniref:ABC transporter permease n=1 Tax=Conexibacter sp. CPCC 206217 TaxID=3064574 RepID=UPI00271CAD4E|nr:ABC transporter permease [Conexibacter sp. CPCC 206217]MDO8211741.1 ABC transporter permease [Conexibacter sp. CPCC 206217]